MPEFVQKNVIEHVSANSQRRPFLVALRAE
jgi:hypothetical protein